MKKPLFVACTAVLLCIELPCSVNAQGILGRMKQKVQDKVNQRVDNATGKATDKALDQVDPNATSGNKGASSSSESNSNTSNSASTGGNTITAYKNYDFVPGDKIILESQLSEERTGEIPSQFVLDKGQMDVQVEDGEKVIHIPKGSGARFHLRLKNQSGIPNQFTVEFDEKNTASTNTTYGISHASVDFGYRVGNISSDFKDVVQGLDMTDDYVRWSMDKDIQYPEPLKGSMRQAIWRHYAIAINQGSGKAYVDQYRVANVNNLEQRVVNIYFNIPDDQDRYIKNIRVAAGGIDLYKKITTNNKIITHGILFDVDQATIQPASMGTLNSIYEILKSNPSMKFEIDGHTDNTGNAAHNLTLSKDRAEAVKAQLVSMGIEPGRLTTKGLGDTKPIGANDSPEGRANNRRVEFIKV